MSETMNFGWILDGTILVTVVTPDLVTVDGPDGKTARRAIDYRRGLQELPHAPEGKIALQLTGPRSKTGEARRGGGLAGHPEQARLTEPGRGFDEHDLAPALSCLGQRAAELRKLTLALQKQRRRLDCHSSSPLLGTAEPYYPVSLSPSREATALVTAPAEGWAADPPDLVAAVVSAKSQTWTSTPEPWTPERRKPPARSCQLPMGRAAAAPSSMVSATRL